MASRRNYRPRRISRSSVRVSRVSRTDIRLWRELKAQVERCPVYIISCHASICESYAQCLTPSRRAGDGIPTFKIPKSTYLLSLPNAGETCRFNYWPHLNTIQRELRAMLTISDPSPYPEAREIWYLDDIIRRVYAITGVHEGIFVFAGCMSPFGAVKNTASIARATKIIDTAERMIYEAELNYPRLAHTLDSDSYLEQDQDFLPLNAGYHNTLMEPSAAYMAEMSRVTGTPLSVLFPESRRHDAEEYKEAQRIRRMKK